MAEAAEHDGRGWPQGGGDLGTDRAGMEAMTAAESLSRAEIEALFGSSDLLQIGQRADAARHALHGNRATYVTVFEIRVDAAEPRTHEIPLAAKEVRLVGRPPS